jgi:hypothetical protein
MESTPQTTREYAISGNAVGRWAGMGIPSEKEWRSASLALAGEVETRGLTARVCLDGVVHIRNPAGQPDTNDPIGGALSPGLQQKVACRTLGGELWWLWAWSGAERDAAAELEPLCPVAEVQRAADRIAHVLAVPTGTAEPVTSMDTVMDIQLHQGRATARAVEREFPGVVAWWGQSTGKWWALVRLGRWCRLVEAREPDQLREVIRHAWNR